MRRLRCSWVVVVLLLVPLASVAAADPDLRVTAPAEGAMLDGTSVTVTFTTTGITIMPLPPRSEGSPAPTPSNRPGEGHVHMRLDLQPIVMWGRDAPYTFTNVPPGAHQLTVELVNNDHTLFSPPVVRQLNFRTRAPTLAVMPNTGNDALLVSAGRTLLILLAAILVALGWGVRGKRVALAPLPQRNRNR